MSEYQIDLVLYKDAKFIGLTDLGKGLPSTAPFLNYQTQERFIETGKADRVEKVKKRVEGSNKHLTNFVEKQILIGHSHQEAEFYSFLVENNLPETLIDTLCKK